MNETIPSQAIGNAEQLLGQSQVAAASALAREVLAAAPESFDARRVLTQLALRAGNGDDEVSAVLDIAGALAASARGSEAEALLREAAERLPTAAELQLALGKLLITSSRGVDAAVCLRQALDIDPRLSEAAVWLAGILRWAGNRSEAIELLRYAVTQRPNDARAQLALGEALTEVGSYAEAIEAYRRCLQIDPHQKHAHNNLSVILVMGGRVSLAMDHAQAALRSDPDFGPAHASLADALRRAGRSESADEVYRGAEERGVLTAAGLDNYLLSANYIAALGPDEVYGRHCQFARACGAIARRFEGSRDAAPERRLRLGYVSADFRDHSVAYFIEAVLARHDCERFAVHCYFNYPTGDRVTDRLRGYATAWRQCHGVSDQQLAEQIREDGIDILIDLAGHSGWNRVRAFACKPAPVQVTWLGYPTTTGLPALDYRITDWEVDPPGYEAYNVEQPVRLRSSYYCYRPYPDSPPIGRSPAACGAPVTFGSFNNLAKVSGLVLELWVRVLLAVPESRLLVKDRNLDDAGVQSAVAESFAASGLGRERLILRGWEPDQREHLRAYAEVDIALDTYPYNGATTSCEALWMGVPMITLKGATHASRMGASLLKAAGLGQWVAESAEEYVHLAVELAGQLEHLEQLRGSLRERLRESRLLDEAGFTRELESVYRQMWVSWCDSSRLEP